MKTDNPARTRNSAENIGEMVCLEKGDAESDVTPRHGALKWLEVRELILACEELSAEIRQTLTILGDAAGTT